MPMLADDQMLNLGNDGKYPQNAKGTNIRLIANCRTE